MIENWIEQKREKQATMKKEREEWAKLSGELNLGIGLIRFRRNEMKAGWIPAIELSEMKRELIELISCLLLLFSLRCN